MRIDLVVAFQSDILSFDILSTNLSSVFRSLQLMSYAPIKTSFVKVRPITSSVILDDSNFGELLSEQFLLRKQVCGFRTDLSFLLSMP